jgi:hypothetical protein
MSSASAEMIGGGEEIAAGGLEIVYRLPLPGWPRALFRSDYGYRGARLSVDGAQVLHATSLEALKAGVEGILPGANDASITMRLEEAGDAPVVVVTAGGSLALREDRVWARPTRSAWNHAFIALAGSAAGIAASAFYLMKAVAMNDDWSRKMGMHTLGWHLLLTFTLFPASVWGQRPGIRTVQFVSLLFFCIHLSMALANMNLTDPAIAFFNAASGVLFMASTIYGQRAYRDMDPVLALRMGRA